MQNLVIMESPTKAATVKNYLGSRYKVMASNGHIRDLPKSTMGIDIDKDFEAHYINIRGKSEIITTLKKEAKAADYVYLATDPDREGEAIAWHLITALEIPESKVRRVTFNAITKSVVKESIKNPRSIDPNIVDAQQTRRILDRIVGYKLSPYLWRTVKSGLSAGRVQSAATKIIVDKENEIRAFVPKEYWTIEAELAGSGNRKFTARFFGTERGVKVDLETREQTEKILDELKGKPFVISDIKKGKKVKNPEPPFTTSTLQQEASRKLNFQSQKTMRVAQELYEGVNLGHENGGAHGLITYMRTDSLRIADEAREAARNYIINNPKLGPDYYPSAPRIYKTKAGAQDAHEAIRPSTEMFEPSKIKKYLTGDQYRLYKLIWDRFISSQMASSVLATTQIDFTAAGYLFRSSGYTVEFPGFMTVYEVSTDESSEKDDGARRLPDASEGEKFDAENIANTQHFTSPPPRFTEASLVKFLEEKGIGRPSTYTTIITIITTRGYVKRDGKSLVPTNLGEVTTRLMNENFPDIVDYRFTASLESQLDAIENGEASMKAVLRKFYGDFEKELKVALSKNEKAEYHNEHEETDIICEKCGAKMIIRNGKFGKFAACPNYPACRNTKPLVERKKAEPVIAKQDGEVMKCEKCGADMVQRTGKFGTFYACSRYPACKFTKQKQKPLGVKCPKCGADMVTKTGKNRNVFYSCSRYPDCDFSVWDMPTNEKCPVCGGMMARKKGKNYLYCINDKCRYKKDIEETEETEE
ncbi:MAG: type I DNA topoisomerase [Clostridia bacterium]|nr:type I DNA topoisomerase [Clostridia bacterium]